MNQSTVKLSVCCITYNQENYIEDALNGFEIQEVNFPLEIIIYDDFSTDTTKEKLINFKKTSKFPVKLLLAKENRFSKGDRIFPKTFVEAQGKYIALCDGDDYWTDPLKLQNQVEFLENNPDYALVFTNGRVNYNNKNFEQHLIYRNALKSDGQYNVFKIPADTTEINILANGNYIHTAGVVFRNWIKKEMIPECLRKSTIGDWPLYMITATYGLIKYLNQDTFCYRVHSRGIFSEKMLIEKYKMTLGQFPSILNSNIFNDEIKTIIINYCKRSSVVYCKNMKSEKDFKYFMNYAKGFNDENRELSKDLLAIAERYRNMNKKSDDIFFYLKGQIKKIGKFL